MPVPLPELEKIDDIDMLVVNYGMISFQCPARFLPGGKERDLYLMMLRNLKEWKEMFGKDGVTKIQIT